MVEVEKHMVDEVDDLPRITRSTHRCFGDGTEELGEGSAPPKVLGKVSRGIFKDPPSRETVLENFNSKPNLNIKVRAPKMPKASTQGQALKLRKSIKRFEECGEIVELRRRWQIPKSTIEGCGRVHVQPQCTKMSEFCKEG